MSKPVVRPFFLDVVAAWFANGCDEEVIFMSLDISEWHRLTTFDFKHEESSTYPT
jgi:hypothetical protein